MIKCDLSPLICLVSIKCTEVHSQGAQNKLSVGVLAVVTLCVMEFRNSRNRMLTSQYL
jgi:hypothetical protein